MKSLPRRSTWALALLVLASLVSATTAADEANPAKAADNADDVSEPLAVPAVGASFHGKLTAAVDEPKWTLRFGGAEGEHETAVADLAYWGRFVEPKQPVQLVLAGGGILVADALRISDDRLVGNSALAGAVDVPLRLVAGIIFEPPTDPRRSDRLLARVLSPAGQADRVILENGDELTGTVSAFDAATLRLQSDTGPVDLERVKLTAVVFNPILTDKPKLSGLRLVIGLIDSSRVTAISLSTDAKGARLKLAGGVALTVPTEAIVALQPLGGRVVYLSDLKPASYRHIPFLELSWPYRLNESVAGRLLRADGCLYLKGIGMHSPSRIAYDVDGRYERFDAEVAIDGETGRRGSVVFRVFVDDGSGSWREAARSEIVRGGEAPVPLSVNLTGVRRISLLVDFADRGDEQDHADWLNARFVR